MRNWAIDDQLESADWKGLIQLDYNSSNANNDNQYTQLLLSLTKTDLEKRLLVANIRHDRYIVQELRDFCATANKRMLGVYGLRRTGKSVMLWTVALELMIHNRNVVFWELSPEISANELILLINKLAENPCEYLFIDEATFVDNFSSWGLYLYNRFSSMGIHVIVSGTYSYTLKLASADILYDRIKLLPTTVITYSEYNYLTGKGIFEFMESGGILDPVNGAWADYLDTAVVNNVVNSMVRLTSPKYKTLANIKSDKVRSLLFYILQEVYLRPILEDLDLEYEYPELEQSLKNLLGRGDSFDDFEVHKTKIDIYSMLKLESILIDNKRAMVLLLRDVLLEMELLDFMDITTITDAGPVRSREYFITQPGLMYYLALVSRDSVLKNILNNTELSANIINVVEGRILENIVFRDTQCKYPNHTVIQLRADGFEIDMVIADLMGNVFLYEIKRSLKAVNLLTKHLTDARINGFLETLFGNYTLKDSAVIYTGCNTMSSNGTKFIDVDQFLQSSLDV